MSTETPARAPRLRTARREEETVTPLELFFDLVFVLAFTQCTALMASEPTWSGLAKGLLVLGVLWWSWVGYAWLTSVVDPEEDAVRLTIFVAMAALLVVGLCVPEAFGDAALIFACAYAAVRIAHVALFMLASRDEPNLRVSVIGLAVSTSSRWSRRGAWRAPSPGASRTRWRATRTRSCTSRWWPASCSSRSA